MPLFFFDHRDGEEFHPDDQGMEFATVEQAQYEATAALGGIAKDALPGTTRRELAIEVSDANRKALFRTALRFEMQTLPG